MAKKSWQEGDECKKQGMIEFQNEVPLQALTVSSPSQATSSSCLFPVEFDNVT